MDELKEPLHKRLLRLREQCGLTVKEVTRAIGVPESTYREWEYGRGLRVPPFEKIAALFTISTTELVTGRMSNMQETLNDLEKIEKLVHDLRQRISSIN